MRAQLVVYLHGDEIQRLTLEPGQDYYAGRHSENPIQLSEHPGISRKHFKISYDGEHWLIEVLSKFGEISHLGERVGSLKIAGDSSFSLGPYEFQIKLDVPPPAEKHLVPSSAQYVEAAPNLLPDEDDGHSWDDATRVGQIQSLPYIRLVQDETQKEYTLRLEGNLWIAGRDASCEIVIPDQHASRKHFELAHTIEGYFVTDLASANGTFVNGSPIRPNEPTAIKSGDVISVLNTKIYFELRDPEFHKKLQVIPQPAIHGPESFQVHYGSASGVSELPSGLPPTHPAPLSRLQKMKDFDWKRHKIRIVIAGLGLLLIWGLFGKNKNNSSITKGANASSPDAFSKLSSDQQQLIKDSYELARSLSAQRKWQMAMDQLKKIHQLVPSYKDSKQMEQELARAIELREDADDIERQNKEREEIKMKVAQLIQNCRQQVTPNTTVPEVEQCLMQARELDPENSDAKALMAQVEEASTEKARQAEEQAERRKRIQHLEALCREAESLYKTGDMFSARKVYQKCVNSNLPDPNGIRDRTKRNLASIDKVITEKVNDLLKSARESYGKSDFKQAINTLNQIRNVDPENPDYKQLNEQVINGANVKMKALYSDSVLEESLGQIDSAKEKWQRIMDMNLKDSEYYQRAVKKLKRYGVI